MGVLGQRFKLLALGLLSVGLYFADIISDIGVVGLMFTTNNLIWAVEGAALLVLQFAVVHWRVIAYLEATRGHVAPLLTAAMVPGVVVLDMLMLLEPFGLLACLRNAELSSFMPAYKATRIPVEVVLESVPQALLQGYIFHRVQGDRANAHLESHAALPPGQPRRPSSPSGDREGQDAGSRASSGDGARGGTLNGVRRGHLCRLAVTLSLLSS